jgi:membrane fusion protein (multidrug efflux system)
MSAAAIPSETVNAENVKAPARESRRGLRIGILIAVLAIAGVAAFQITSWLGSFESTDDAQIDGHLNAISARVGGYVVQVNVEENQYVKAGAVLAQIDPRDYQVAVAKARADLADAAATAKASQADVPITASTTENTLANTRAGEFDAQRGISAAQRSLEAAAARVSSAKAKLQEEQANYEKAASDEKRYKQLVDKDEISKQQYDSASAAAHAQQAAVESARASVIEAQQNVDMVSAQVEQDRARLDQARAQVSTALTGPQQVTISRARYESSAAKAQQEQALLDQAQLNLGYTTIVAPVSGLVGRKSVELGQNVGVGQQLMTIVPTDDIWITANFKETQLRRMHPGQRVKVHADGYDRDYNGKVESIAPAAGARFSLLPPENATGNYVKVVQRVPVRIRLDPGQDPDHLLRPGMSVVPKVYLQ